MLMSYRGIKWFNEGDKHSLFSNRLFYALNALIQPSRLPILSTLGESVSLHIFDCLSPPGWLVATLRTDRTASVLAYAHDEVRITTLLCQYNNFGASGEEKMDGGGDGKIPVGGTEQPNNGS